MTALPDWLCGHCGGTGHVRQCGLEAECPECHGDGKYAAREIVAELNPCIELGAD